jgi:hypothetical protein
MLLVILENKYIKLISLFLITCLWYFVTYYFCQKTWYKCFILTFVHIGIRKYHWCLQEMVIPVRKFFMYVSLCVNYEKYKISVKMKIHLTFVCRYVPVPHYRLLYLTWAEPGNPSGLLCATCYYPPDLLHGPEIWYLYKRENTFMSNAVPISERELLFLYATTFHTPFRPIRVAITVR